MNRAVRPLAFIGAVLAVFLLGASTGAAARGPTRIVLIVKPISSRSVDKPPKGPSAGDRSVDATKLLNAVPQFGKPAGAVVGHDKGTATLLSPTSATGQGVAYLPGGTLTFSGLLKPDRKRGGFTIPVTRGTGAFAGARGTLWVVRVPEPLRTLNVYTLRYAASA
jgi:hypothetical protein